MADDQNVGTDADPGAGSTPSQPVSQPAQTPIDGKVTELLAGLEGKFDSLSKELRGLQSRQDKSDNTFRQWLAKVEQYEKQGMSRDEAIAELEADDRSEQRWTSLEKKLDDLAARIASGGTQANEQQSVAKVFEAIGLDPKDPRVAMALTKRYESAEQVELAAYRLQRELASQPNPTNAQSAALQGGGANQGQSNLDALAEEYNRLSVNPAENYERMAQIQKEMDGIK